MTCNLWSLQKASRTPPRSAPWRGSSSQSPRSTSQHRRQPTERTRNRGLHLRLEAEQELVPLKLRLMQLMMDAGLPRE